MDNEEREYIAIPSSITVLPKGDPIFSEAATEIRIEDNAAGPFLVIKQTYESNGQITIAKEEWPQIKKAIEDMLKVIEKLENTQK